MATRCGPFAMALGLKLGSSSGSSSSPKKTICDNGKGTDGHEELGDDEEDEDEEEVKRLLRCLLPPCLFGDSVWPHLFT